MLQTKTQDLMQQLDAEKQRRVKRQANLDEISAVSNSCEEELGKQADMLQTKTLDLMQQLHSDTVQRMECESKQEEVGAGDAAGLFSKVDR